MTIVLQASESLWERPYMQYLQLVVGNVRGILSLQCFYDGKLAGSLVGWAFLLLLPIPSFCGVYERQLMKVRQILAFIMPTAPLLLLLCCGCVEVFKRGSGLLKRRGFPSQGMRWFPASRFFYHASRTLWVIFGLFSNNPSFGSMSKESMPL